MVVDDMIPSEADQPTHGQQQAVLGASVIALPWVAPKVEQVWPDFATACLRTSGSEAKIIEARLVTARR